MKLEKITMKVIRGKLESLIGRIPVARIPKALIPLAIRYHFFNERKESTRGAQTNLKIWGRTPAAIKAATFSTEIPSLVKRKARVTEIYPVMMPNGRISNVNIDG